MVILGIALILIGIIIIFLGGKADGSDGGCLTIIIGAFIFHCGVACLSLA